MPKRKPPKRDKDKKAPGKEVRLPGPHQFDAAQEQAMRAGYRKQRMAPLPTDGDADDME